MARRAVRVALVIGTLLFVINHGAAVRSGMTQARWLSAGLTYLVPYAVSIHGQYMGRGSGSQGMGS
jgi:hypothetical protein